MKIYALGSWLLWFLFSLIDFRLGWVVSHYLDSSAFSNLFGIMIGMMVFVLGAGIVRWTFLWRQIDRKNWILLASNMDLLVSFAVGILLFLAVCIGDPQFPCSPVQLILGFLAGGLFGAASGFPLISILGRPLSPTAAA
jgi:hypothetical protein